MSDSPEPNPWPAADSSAAGRHASPGWSGGAADGGRFGGQPWGWRDLWRHGGLGAVLVVFASLWLLVALWMVSGDAPSAGGTPPDILIVDPASIDGS